MNAFIARVKVVLAAAVTWIVVASTVVTLASDEIAKVLPAGDAETVGAVATKIVTVLLTVVAIIRRVQPVLPAERGILPTTED